jgi:hypothetical protein
MVWGWGKGEEMTQTLYAHMNKKNAPLHCFHLFYTPENFERVAQNVNIHKKLVYNKQCKSSCHLATGI